MYGSIFWSVTLKPRASRSAPIDAAASPLPRDDTTPPVTKMYFVATSASLRRPLSDEFDLHGAISQAPVQAAVAQLGEHLRHPGPPRDAERHDVVPRERDEAPVEAEIPVERRPHAGVAGEPEPRELDGRAVPELARHGARRRRGREAPGERRGVVEAACEPGERVAREREPGERRGRHRARLVGQKDERGELHRGRVEAPRARPAERRREGATATPGGRAEAITRVEQLPDTRRAALHEHGIRA